MHSVHSGRFVYIEDSTGRLYINYPHGKVYVMTTDNIVDLAMGLVSAKPVPPPFKITVPAGTDLNAPYEESGKTKTLREKLLSLDSVAEVEVGKGTGVSIDHSEKKVPLADQPMTDPK